MATSPEAVKAIAWAFRCEDPVVNPGFISLSYLKSKPFADMRDKPVAQALAINMLVRYAQSVSTSARGIHDPLSYHAPKSTVRCRKSGSLVACFGGI